MNGINNAARYDDEIDMNSETEKLLGILEFYNHGKMFVWDKSIKGNCIEMPPVQSMEELENNPELIKHFRKKSEQ